MRILFIHEVSYEEKPVFEMHEIPEHLSKKGHVVAFIDLIERREKGAEEGGPQEFMRNRVVQDARVEAFHQIQPVAGVFGRLLAAFLSPFFVFFAMKRFRPEVIFLYGVPTNGWSAVLIARILGVPVIFRSLDVSHLIRRTAFFGLVWLAEVIVFRLSTLISANNPELARYARKLGAHPEKVSIEIAPVDLRHFKSEVPYKASRRPPVITYMGSFFYFGGLIEAITTFAEKAKSNHRLLLVGGGELESKIRLHVSKLGLTQQVHFHGYASYQELPEIFSRTKVAINPMVASRVSNLALPHKVIQYMGSGLPVVSSKLEGLAAVFGDNSAIRFQDDPTSVMSCAIDLLENDDVCDDMSMSGLARVSSVTDLDRSIESFENLLLRSRAS